jgi:ComF family protein
VCAADITLITPPFCTCCGMSFNFAAGGSHLCSTCLNSPYFFSKARAILAYNDGAAKLIHSFKYNGSTAQFSTFKDLWEKSGLENDLCSPDLIIPVPLHLERLRERGFNQALLLAQIFFSHQKEKISPHLLKRLKKTPHQTTLSGQARRKNMKTAFAVSNQEMIKGKNIILIDDVFTTGTTINECAKILHQAGAHEIQVLTLARAMVRK